MKFLTLAATVFFLACALPSNAQKKIDRSKFSEVDKYVAGLGPMEGHLLKYIVDTLTHRQTVDQASQVRAMYMWEANNIDYNTSGRRHPKQDNPSASTALNTRTATHAGYANLFKAMCDLAHIQCVVIPGMAKFDPRDIGKLSPKWNRHTWNAVQIDGVWYLLDVAWSAGKTDRKFRFFKKSFTDAWFLTDRELFGLSHYPDDKKWQLLDTPYNKSNFTHAPIIGSSAIVNEVYPDVIRGNVRGKADTTKKLSFEVSDPSLIKSVTVTRRTSEKVPVKYTFDGNKMYLDIPFSSEGDYPFNLYINDALAYTYKADVSKAKKKPVVKKKPAAKKKSPAKKKPAAKKKTQAKKPAQKEVKREKKQPTEKATKKKSSKTEK